MKWARYCPRCGAAGFDSTHGRRLHCHACAFEYYHNVASAVGALLLYGDEVLLVVRAREPGRGLLDLPGGFVDAGEDLETALAREVKEELGLVLPPGRYLCSAQNHYPYAEVDYLTLDVFFVHRYSERPEFNLSDEIADARWMPVTAVQPFMLAFVSVRVALERLLALEPTTRK